MSYKLEIVDFSGETQSLSPPDLLAYLPRVINTQGLARLLLGEDLLRSRVLSHS